MGWGRIALAIAVPSAGPQRPCAARGRAHTFQADRLPDLTGQKGAQVPPAPAPTPLHSKPCCGAAEGQRKVETGHLGHSAETEGTPSPGSMRRGALHPKGSGQITQAPSAVFCPPRVTGRTEGEDGHLCV